MPKIYAKCSSKMDNLKPKQEIINFILNYSKALHIIKLKTIQIEMLKN